MPVVIATIMISMIVIRVPRVPMPIALIGSAEVLRRISAMTVSMFAAFRIVPMIAMARIKVIIYMPMEIVVPVKPRPSANKDAAVKPLRAIVPIRSAVVRRIRIVPIWTNRRRTNADAQLG